MINGIQTIRYIYIHVTCNTFRTRPWMASPSAWRWVHWSSWSRASTSIPGLRWNAGIFTGESKIQSSWVIQSSAPMPGMWTGGRKCSFSTESKRIDRRGQVKPWPWIKSRVPFCSHQNKWYLWMFITPNMIGYRFQHSNTCSRGVAGVIQMKIPHRV
jgi:hypothetical protein